MRLRRLQVQRFGHFADAVLDLPGDGLQVIHGSNEAGKSTLLQFIRELLFGFAERNKYSFGEGKLEGSGLLEFQDLETFELKRRKGRPDALTAIRNGIPESLLEADLQRKLGGANHQLFQNVFAFGLSELASGEDSLRIEAVQNALHGSGSSGITNPQKILDQLAKESDAIFKKNGKLQVITLLCKEIKDGLAELKKKTTKTDTYLQLKREFDSARKTAEQMASELTQLRREQSRVKKLVTAYPLWRELLDLEKARTEQGEVPPFDLDARPKYDKLTDDLKRLAKDIGKLEREIQSTEAELASIPAQTEWLGLRAQIEQARELIKSVQDARRDLPVLESEVQATTRLVERGLQDVIAEWTIDQLREFRCDQNQRFQCEEFVTLKHQLEAERRRLAEREADLREAQAEALAEQESIGEIPDVSRLQALVSRQPESLAREADLERLIKELAKQQRLITTQIRKLSPPLPSDVADVSQMPVLPREEIAVHQQAISRAQECVTAAQRSLDEAAKRHAQLEQELLAIRGNHSEELPTREKLRLLREDRDAQWETIWQQVIDPANLDRAPASQPNLMTNQEATHETAAAAERFLSTLKQADRYADELFDNASLVTKQEQVDAAWNIVIAKREELSQAQVVVTEALDHWRGVWAPCGIEPLDPATMLQWKATHESVLGLYEKRDDLQDELTRLEAAAAAFQVELRLEFPESAGSLKATFDAAQLRISKSQQLSQESKNLQKNLIRLTRQADVLRQDQLTFESRWNDYITRWRDWLTPFTFSRDWHPEQTLDTVNRLQNLRDKLELIPSLKDRITAIQRRLAEFDPLVLQVCKVVAPEWTSLPTDLAARNLDDRLQSAIATHQRRNELSRELTKYQNKVSDLHQQQQAALKLLQEWFTAAHVDSDQEFLDLLQRAEAIREMDRAIQSKRQQLDVARDLEDPTLFFQQLQETNYPAAKQLLEELDGKLVTLSEQERQVNQEKGAKENEWHQIDGSSAAAELQGNITNRRAALANAVDRYVPLLFAQELLQQTLKRFERESQPEMLGEVGRLFAAMTGNRYVRVERPRDQSRPILVYRPDGQDLEPNDLSMGTREQLYLSIRLAYVLHYCTKAEPLPVVLDDVFANFDPGRTRRTLEAIGKITDRVQVILFTCHPHVVQLAQDVFPHLRPVEVPSTIGSQVHQQQHLF